MILSGNGIKYYFASSEKTNIYLAGKIKDPYGNYIKINYKMNSNNQNTERIASIEHFQIGMSSSKIRIKFNYIPHPEGDDFDEKIPEVLQSIDFLKEDGSYGDTITFNISDITLDRPGDPDVGICRAYAYNTNSCLEPFHGECTLPILNSINFQDGTNYSFEYITSYNPPGASQYFLGRIKSLKLPTGGKVEYGYKEWISRWIYKEDPTQCPDSNKWDRPIPAGIEIKRYYDKNGNEIGYKEFSYASLNGYNNPETSTEVKTYDNNQLISYEKAFFSTGIIDNFTNCNYVYEPVDYGSLKRVESYDSNNNLLKKEEYTYDYDAWVEGTLRNHRNFRQLTNETYYRRDDGSWDITSTCNDKSSYVNFGHYKKVYIKDGDCSTGTIKKTIETNWTPNSSSWILNIYDKTKVYEGGNISSLTKMEI